MELQIKNATVAIAEEQAKAAAAQERLVAAEAEIKEVQQCHALQLGMLEAQ